MELFNKKYIKYFLYTLLAVAIITVFSMLLVVIISFWFRDANIAFMASFFISLIATVIYCTFLIMDKLKK